MARRSHGLLADDSGEAGDPVESSSHGVTGFRCEVVGYGLSEADGTEDGASEVKVEVNHTN